MKNKQRGEGPIRGDAESWRKLIASQSESGKSVKAFCSTKGISTSAYYRWQKLLKEEAVQGFSPIELSGPPSISEVVVGLPGGLSLRFSGLPPASYLRSLSESFKGAEP